MATCVACQQPLILEIDGSDDDEDVEVGGLSSAPTPSATKTVPDDVGLACGCHFHWQCLLDAYTVTECPNCGTNLATPSPSGGEQVLCTLKNEGGLQENLDILPLLTEESYLRAYPEERKCRAFLEFCREGEVQAIVAMLQDDEDEEETMQEGEPIDVLRYQDPIGDMQSGLHAAVAGGSREVAWLLLLLASELDLQQFPAPVFQEAGAMGLMREDQTGKVDIRSLKDAQGRTAEDLAAAMGGVWVGWPGTGRLAV
ncbi:hypothetical protein W97_03030 [Coniosporium apollinis CBS 100218]|uniref:Uncharacterized protein n=1 Tax=Coniosporium apollinis (strain CBS 100218) TaxID=1168221 RepID=R7YPH7_CONA1|nr:uncharacterized protein W97_03030 [Coniosporium apollinis CBS 100218]EON63802.1 hypothetical protein W97_03030 [Coniosporium apollinis CBS 100218]